MQIHVANLKPIFPFHQYDIEIKDITLKPILSHIYKNLTKTRQNQVKPLFSTSTIKNTIIDRSKGIRVHLGEKGKHKVTNTIWCSC